MLDMLSIRLLSTNYLRFVKVSHKFSQLSLGLFGSSLKKFVLTTSQEYEVSTRDTRSGLLIRNRRAYNITCAGDRRMNQSNDKTDTVNRRTQRFHNHG